MRKKNKISKEDLEAINPILEQWGINYKKEVLLVKELGESIGYGNMMSIASALWALSLNEEWGLNSGAFIPTIPQFMLKKEGKKAAEEQKRQMEYLKTLLKK